MGLESTQARMSHAGRSLLFSGEILTPEAILAAYDAVTREDVMALARDLFQWDQASLSAVGQVLLRKGVPGPGAGGVSPRRKEKERPLWQRAKGVVFCWGSVPGVGPGAWGCLRQVVPSGLAQVSPCGVVPRPVPGGGSRLSLEKARTQRVAGGGPPAPPG